MVRSAKGKSKSTKTTHDDLDMTKFPEIDKDFITFIWKEQQKGQHYSGSARLAGLIRSLVADISTPNGGLDSITNSDASSSSVAGAGQAADDNPNSSSVSDFELCVDLTSYSMIDLTANRIADRVAKDLRIPKEKAVKSKHEGNGNGSKQNLKKCRQSNS